MTRKQLGIAFIGETIETDRLLAADVTVEGEGLTQGVSFSSPSFLVH